MKKLKYLYIFFMIFGLADYSLASDFSNIIPGKTTFSAMKKIMGKPDEIAIKGERYIYKYDKDNIERVLITIDPQTKKVVAVNLEFANLLERDYVREKYDLQKPDIITQDVWNNNIEYYKDKNISLHFENSQVAMLRYYDPEIINPDVLRFEGKGDELKTSDMAKAQNVINYNIKALSSIGYEPDSFGQTTAPEPKIKVETAEVKYPKAVQKYIKKRTKGKSYLTAQQKNIRQNNVDVDNKIINEKDIKELQQKKDDYAQAKVFLEEAKYKQAIPYFKKSLAVHPHKSHEALGICFLKLKEIKNATKHLNEAMRLNKKAPDTVFFYAILHEELNKPLSAQSYYKKYLRIKHDNPQMNKFAKERLYELKRKRGLSLGRGIFKAFEAINKEMRDFNSE